MYMFNKEENKVTSLQERIKKSKPTIKLVNPQDETDVQDVPVELKLNLKKIMFIARDYPEANDIATLQVSNDGMKVDMIQLYKLVYVAYRMANMNEYLSFDEFQEVYEFDMEEANNIYFSMLSKSFRTSYLEKITKASEKVSRTVKQDNSKQES